MAVLVNALVVALLLVSVVAVWLWRELSTRVARERETMAVLGEISTGLRAGLEELPSPDTLDAEVKRLRDERPGRVAPYRYIAPYAYRTPRPRVAPSMWRSQ